MSEPRTPKSIGRIEEALKPAIQDYLKWIASSGYAHSTQQAYNHELSQFLEFIEHGKYQCNTIFIRNTFEAFKKHIGATSAAAVTGLSRYLYEQGKIPRYLHRKKQGKDLPPIYEQYLAYHQKNSQVPSDE